MSERPEHYPHSPGWKAGETAKAAARVMREPAKSLEAWCLSVLKSGPQTPEQVRARIEVETGRPVLLNSIRPRFSQLKARGLVRDSGARGLGEGGRCLAIKWELVPVGEGDGDQRA